MKRLRQTEKSYIAGIIDGDGTINIIRRNPTKLTKSQGMKSPNHSLRISVGNTHLGLLEYLKRATGIGHVYRLHTQGKNKIWIWECGAKDAVSVLEAALPYFVVKWEEALIAISFQRYLAETSSRGKLLEPEVIAKREDYKLQLEEARRKKLIPREVV